VSGAPLRRSAGGGTVAAPVRLLHVGLGNFFRAHQAAYTGNAPDSAEWGYAAFAGRSPGLADQLSAQDGLYTLVSRAREADSFTVIGSVSRVHAATDHAAFLDYFASADLAAVTLTVTEAGYFRRPDGGLDTDRPEVATDLEVLRRDPTALVLTPPARLVAGLAARRRADAGPLAIVSCDNVPDNGAIVGRVIRELAELVDPGLAGWLDESMSTVTTVVDRITPRTVPEDVRTVAAATGVDDLCPVVTEPFTEWVLSGSFPAGRPRWEQAGAIFTVDAAPYERRKLWLLNGAHSLLAYAGSIRGHTTVAEAIDDEACRSAVEQWWSEASAQLTQPGDELAAYRAALLERFANPRIRHLLAQIAADGSQKLPIRVVPVLLAERAAGRLPGGATFILAAWICHLRGLGAAVVDARADEVVPLAVGALSEAVPRVLRSLDPAPADDSELVSAVIARVQQLSGGGRQP
jgi:fructuronate reductase